MGGKIECAPRIDPEKDGSPVTGYIKAGLVIGFSGLIALGWGTQS